MHPALQILRIPTAPRHEKLVAVFICSYLKRLKIPFKQDRFGNIVARLRSVRGDHPVAFGAHMDHPGFEVIKISKGKATCAFLGGVPQSYFRRGIPVELFDDQGNHAAQGSVLKILKWAPPHKHILLKLISGFGFSAKFGMWKLPLLKMTKTHVINRACDDLGGCAAILSMLELLIRTRSKVNIYGIFTQREEIEFKAVSEIASSGLLPKSVPVISIETSKVLSNAPQGAGPIVRVGDERSIFDPELSRQLCLVGNRLQEKGRFPFQRKLMDGGTCEATAYIENGYVAGGMCVALGNYHNCGKNGKIAAENIRLDDWQGLVQFMAGVAKYLKI